MDQRFEGVPDTLFIPLWARIEASKRFPELLFDQLALALEPALAGRALAGTTSEFNLLSSAVRVHVMDAMAEDFITAHGLFDLAWTDAVPHDKPILIYAAGVFPYFDEERIVSLMQDLRRIFPGAELIFDAVDSRGLRYAERYVEKTGNASAAMHFAVDDAAAFAEKAGVTLIAREPFFGNALRLLKGKIGLYTRISMQVCDRQDRLKVIRVKL